MTGGGETFLRWCQLPGVDNSFPPSPGGTSSRAQGGVGGLHPRAFRDCHMAWSGELRGGSRRRHQALCRYGGPRDCLSYIGHCRGPTSPNAPPELLAPACHPAPREMLSAQSLGVRPRGNALPGRLRWPLLPQVRVARFTAPRAPGLTLRKHPHSFPGLPSVY